MLLENITVVSLLRNKGALQLKHKTLQYMGFFVCLAALKKVA